MNKLLLAFFFFFLSLKVFAFTGNETRYLKYGDTLMVSINDFQEKFFSHKLENKQTLFSMAKFYGLKINELYYYNPELVNTAPKVGQLIKIPLPNRAMIRERDKKFKVKSSIPVFYVVRTQENLLKIAEIYFNMKADSLKSRNKLTNDALKVGQKLLIGWVSVEGITEEQRKIKGPAILQILQNNRALHQNESVGKKMYSNRGIAFWQKDSKMGSGLYALHRDCPENTMVAIHNPMKNKTIYAKVIGKIPPGTQDDAVEVVISPSAAKLLGALDPKFFVKVKYFK